MTKTLPLAAIALFCVLAHTNPTRAGNIEGSIKDLAGRLVAGATVYARYNSRAGDQRQRVTTLSDANGLFILRDLAAGSYGVFSYKESAGYPNPFFAFFADSKAYGIARVSERGTSKILLTLGPKCARLRLSIRNEEGMPVGGALTLTRVAAPEAPVIVGANSESTVLVPPVPFRFEITADGYETWKSGILKPRSGETVESVVSLKRSLNTGMQYRFFA